MEKATVVVPTYNRADSLIRMLKSLREQKLKQFKVIIIDDNSTDNTLEAIRENKGSLNIKVLHNEKNMGAGYSRNKGIKESKSKYIAFIDDDCTADPEWISDFYSFMESNPDVDGAGGMVFYPRNANILMKSIYYLPQMNENTLAIQDAGKPIPVKNLSCTNSIWRRKVLEELGGFDIKLRRGQDTDLSYRAGKHRLMGIPKAKVHHHYRTSIASFVKQQFVSGAGGANIVRKHPGFFSIPQRILMYVFPLYIIAGIMFPLVFVLPLLACRSGISAYKHTRSLALLFSTTILQYIKYHINLFGIWKGLIFH